MTTEANFLRDVADHRITVLRDEGVNRHIRFRKPGTVCMGFDLITWPGHLCYTGDMGAYVFQRLEDMFVFFRTDQHPERIGINKRYWSEKVLAADRHGGIKEFSESKFQRAVMDDLIYWIRDRADLTTKEERRELWERVKEEVLNAEGDKLGAAFNFSDPVNDRVRGFWFQDFWDHDVEDYTHHFVWCCYAIAWGIQQYDAAREAAKRNHPEQPLGMVDGLNQLRTWIESHRYRLRGAEHESVQREVDQILAATDLSIQRRVHS